jgi:hypothetical protein
MKFTVMISSALLLVPLALSAAPVIESGRISFVGQIAEFTCAIQSTRAVQFSESRNLQVVPGVQLEVSTHKNTCAGGSLPLSTTFEPLADNPAVSVSQPVRGIVTVTYL